MKTIIFLILSMALLACQNGSFNDPLSSNMANRATSFKTCSEVFTTPEGKINDTTEVIHEYRFHGNLKDTSGLIPHTYLDSSNGMPFNCPYGGHPAPYKWTWNVEGNESCNIHNVRTLEYACPVYVLWIPIKFE